MLKVVTEAGFGSDIGLEKFFNIKCRTSNLNPNCVVLVCTTRALKMHGGGTVLPFLEPKMKLREMSLPNMEALARGICNLTHHIQISKSFGLPVVVSINGYDSDSSEELEFICAEAIAAGTN